MNDLTSSKMLEPRVRRIRAVALAESSAPSAGRSNAILEFGYVNLLEGPSIASCRAWRSFGLWAETRRAAGDVAIPGRKWKLVRSGVWQGTTC